MTIVALTLNQAVATNAGRMSIYGVAGSVDLSARFFAGHSALPMIQYITKLNTADITAEGVNLVLMGMVNLITKTKTVTMLGLLVCIA